MKNTLKLTVFLSLALTACTGHKVQQAISDSSASAQASREDGGKIVEDPNIVTSDLQAHDSEFGVDESRKDIQVGRYRFRLPRYLCASSGGTTGRALDLWVNDLSRLPGVNITSGCDSSDPVLDIAILTTQQSNDGVIATQTRQTWDQCELFTSNMNNDFRSDTSGVQTPRLFCTRSQVNPAYAFVVFRFFLPNSYYSPQSRILGFNVEKVNGDFRPVVSVFGQYDVNSANIGAGCIRKSTRTVLPFLKPSITYSLNNQTNMAMPVDEDTICGIRVDGLPYGHGL